MPLHFLQRAMVPKEAHTPKIATAHVRAMPEVTLRLDATIFF